MDDLVDFPVDIYTTHVVLRGTYLPGTVRCTPGPRTQDPSYTGGQSGGLSIYCFTDVRVNAYLLGSGPPLLTVIVDSSLYQSSYAYGASDEDYGLEQLESRRRAYERALAEGGPFGYDYPLKGHLPPAGTEGPLSLEYLRDGPVITGPPGGIGGREVVMFIGPSFNLSVEAWRVLWTWVVERREDNTVVALHPYRQWLTFEEYQSAGEMELPALTQAVTAAHQARVAANGGRIGEDASLPMLQTDANRLRQYFEDPKVGGYAPGAPTPSQPPAVYAPAPGSLSAMASGEEAADLSWGSVSDASGYQVQQRISGYESWTTLDASVTGTTYAVSGLWCGKTHEFRVGAYGDGATYNARVGLWSDTATAATDTCSPQPPRFDEASYSFEVSVAAFVGDAVGTVSAIDVNDDPVTYSISAGNDAAKFDIDTSTGEISVKASVGSSAVTTYTLTVGAADGVSGTTTVTVTVTVAEADCTEGMAVSDPGGEPDLVSDCEMLLGLRDALAGTGSLDWGLSRAITDWEGVTVRGTPMRVAELDLSSSGLTGVIPAGLSELTGLKRLNLGFNLLTGSIPVELGGLSELSYLEISSNPNLSGQIPVELAMLSELAGLWLQLNDLSGPIPPELGNLTKLEGLGLSDNDLSGSIPWSLGDLARLITLRVSGNSLEGCVRPSLRTVLVNDLTDLGLPDCTEEGRVPTPDGVSVSLADGTFTITWDAVTGASKYEAQHTTDAADAATVTWTALAETTGTTQDYTPAGGVTCSTEYRFRVRAYGDGTAYVAEWGAESTAESVATESCPPEFDETSYGFMVAEDAAVDDDVGTVSATDPDDGDTVSYSINAGNTGSVFAIDDETGEITVAAALDHETTGSYSLTVGAEDDSGRTDTVTVTITVTDEDEAPEFDETIYAFTVAEDAAVDDDVGTVSATDPDDGDTVSYAITAGNTGNAFDIDDETGEITVAAALDHETTGSYSLTVEAEDDSGQTDTVMVAITVTDVAEDAAPPPGNLGVTLADGVFSLTWDSVAGAAKYEAQHTTDAADAATVTWTALAETMGTT